MIVVLTEEAEGDLERIADWIAADNPRRAIAFVQMLREKCLGLADAPRGYELVPRFADLGIRQRPFRDYLIFYRVTDVIEVVHILHGAQDWEHLLEPRG